MQENTNHSQKLTLEDRKRLSIDGVTDVLVSNATNIKLNTNFGKLSIIGANLKITGIDLKTKIFTATGVINKIEYKSTDNSKISKLLK